MDSLYPRGAVGGAQKLTPTVLVPHTVRGQRGQVKGRMVGFKAPRLHVDIMNPPILLVGPHRVWNAGLPRTNISTPMADQT